MHWLISFFSTMNWALIVTITERNQKDFLRLSETRLRYSLLLGQQNRLISTLQLINIANVFSYHHTMLIRPWHSLNINQFHSHSFVFNRRLVYFFKNSLWLPTLRCWQNDVKIVAILLLYYWFWYINRQLVVQCPNR